VLFARICRDNAITHRITQPASPTTGKEERFHGSLCREFLDHAEPFDSALATETDGQGGADRRLVQVDPADAGGTDLGSVS
jgi:hypothetical protein